MVMPLEIDFDAEMPKLTRAGGGAGRQATPWEQLLDPARSNPGRFGKLFEFSDRTNEDGSVTSAKVQASSRSVVIQARLHKTVPLERWRFTVRPTGDNTAGLWVAFTGVMTPDEYAEYEQRRSERAERIRAGREAGKAANNGNASTNEVSATDEAQTSAADKVRAARAKRLVKPEEE